MQLDDDISFEVYFGKIVEIKFAENSSGVFRQNFLRPFFGKFQKIIIGIGL